MSFRQGLPGRFAPSVLSLDSTPAPPAGGILSWTGGIILPDKRYSQCGHEVLITRNIHVPLAYCGHARNGAMDGAFFETYVISEIVKSYYNTGKYPNLYYYRDVDQKEIDLLIAEGDRLYPIEIKKAKMPHAPDKNFGVLRRFDLDIQPGIVICMCDEMLPHNRQTWYFPVSAL